MEGADPDASYTDPNSPESSQTCLYGASGVNDNPQLVALLLSYGANANDGEALYHSVEHRDLRCLRLILEAGGDPRGTNCLAHVLDYDDLEGLTLVLDHYGPPDEELNNAFHHALIRGRSVAHLRKLVEHGANLAYRRGGLTSYARARLLGETEAAEYLAQAGAETDLDNGERYTVACIEGDQSVPAVPIPPLLQGFLSYAARDGRVDAVRRLLAAGCEPDIKADSGLTGLHQAGLHGQAEAVQVLLDAGASLSEKDTHHNGTPLDWTVAGAAWGVRPEGDHLGAARIMLEHGAVAYCDADWILGLCKEMPDMRALLESQGIQVRS
jgi:ankyrin repeat protein